MLQNYAKSSLLTSCLIAPCLLALPASAQGEESEQRQQTVIVTALKQGATTLDTAATVSVVGDEEIAALNISSAADLGGIIPGYVTMQGTAGAANTFRGLGTNSADPTIESAVATFVDGVYLGHTRDLIMPLYDVDSVEFIPGTQATLLGKNSSLGAINITNRRPGDAFAFDASATYVSEIEGTKLEGGVDVPLGPVWTARLAGFWNDEQGYLTNRLLDRSERQLTQTSGRLTLAGNIGDRGDLTFVYQRDERDSTGHTLKVLTDPNFEIRGLAGAIGQTDFVVGENDIHQSGSEALFPGDIAGSGQFDDQSGNRATLIATFDIGNSHTITAQTGYVDWNSSRVTDLDFTRYRIIDLIDDEDNEVLSQEVRINSGDGPFTYLAGVYYYQNNYSLGRDVLAQPDAVLGFSGLSESSNEIDTEAWSAFASGKTELTSQLALTAGLRYTDESKTVTYERTTTDTIGLVLAGPLPRTTLPSQNSSEVDGDIGLQYTPNGNSLYYVTFARGSKSGGFQSSPDSFESAPYEGEVAYTAEAGGKFRIGNDASATFAIFNTTVEDFQVGRVENLNGFPQTVIDNSKIRSRGAEGSFQWDATRNLKLDGAVVYADAEFTEDLFSDDGAGGQVLEAFDGMRLPRAPEWTAKLAADYVRDISSGLNLSLRGSIRYTSETDLQFQASNPFSPVAEAHTLFDARIALGSQRGGWTLSLIGNNLTDERYIDFATDAPLAPSGEAYYGRLSKPRTIAIQLTIAG